MSFNYTHIVTEKERCRKQSSHFWNQRILRTQCVSLGGDTDTLGAITGSIAEAFYGIPAVLIAECKSRIDKGLMTDILDEFDHVLGSRSVF
jgi:ADP-ribosylglycohydrolase